jgi:hypothetical protein
MYLDVALGERCTTAWTSSSRAGDLVRRVLERLRPRDGRANLASFDTPILAALRARLEAIEREVDRITRFALSEDDVARQDACLALARDLQRDAREIREQIRLQEG